MDHIRKRVDAYVQQTTENQRLEHQGVAFLLVGVGCIVVMLTLLLS